MSESNLKRRIQDAMEIIIRYASIDGEHHKTWCIDQIARKLLDNEYEDFIEEMNSDEEYEQWDEGIAP